MVAESGRVMFFIWVLTFENVDKSENKKLYGANQINFDCSVLKIKFGVIRVIFYHDVKVRWVNIHLTFTLG